MKKETLWVAGIPAALIALGLPQAAASQPVRALSPVVVTAPGGGRAPGGADRSQSAAPARTRP